MDKGVLKDLVVSQEMGDGDFSLSCRDISMGIQSFFLFKIWSFFTCVVL